jgi:wobble nucleotide-excising tRNase
MWENKSLKQQKLDMESKCDRQKESIKTYTDEISRIEAALFNAKSEVKTLLFNRTNNAVEAA